MQRRRADHWTSIGLVGLFVTGGLFFAWVFVAPIDLPFQSAPATINVTSSVDGRTIHVIGTTDLPDGALVDYSFYSEDQNLINDLPDGGTVAVRDGAFAFTTTVPGRSTGLATAEVSFSVAWGTTQPKGVTDRFGSQGEHLAGPQVYVDSPGDPKQLVTTTSVMLDR